MFFEGFQYSPFYSRKERDLGGEYGAGKEGGWVSISPPRVEGLGKQFYSG
jgi:hypothetical protein